MTEAWLALVAGLLIGSFLNVCIYRMPRDISVVRPRSYCPRCDRTVAWFDNIPLVSYLALRGRCRHCRGRIPFRYPLVEGLTGVLFLASVQSRGPTLEAFKLCLLSALLVGLIFADLEERILPDEFTLGGTLAGIALAALVPLESGILALFFPPEWSARWASVLHAVLAAAVCSGSIWFIGVAYSRLRGREGLGFGDVKMVAMLGAFLGVQGALMTLILGSMAGAVLGLMFIVATRKQASTYELPFGSFLGAAALGYAFLGRSLLAWYTRLGA